MASGNNEDSGNVRGKPTVSSSEVNGPSIGVGASPTGVVESGTKELKPESSLQTAGEQSTSTRGTTLAPENAAPSNREGLSRNEAQTHSSTTTQNATSPSGSSGISVLKADEVRASQETASYRKRDRNTNEEYTYDDIVNGMREKGWQGEPLDVVKMPDGKLTSVDNTRVAAAREAGIDVHARIHEFTDPLPDNMLKPPRFGSAKTWGETATGRINKQSKKFSSQNPHGSDAPPQITGRPK